MQLIIKRTWQTRYFVVAPDPVLVLRPGFVKSSSFPMTSPSPLLMAATPARPSAGGFGIRRAGPDQVPEPAAYFRHGERQQIGLEIGLEIGRAFFPRPRHGGAWRDRHAPASPA
jgi:hypothetical protein